MTDESRWARRAHSFRYAFRGLLRMIQSEPNARIHLGATFVVVASGAALGLERLEWGLVTLAIAFVWSCEAINTAIEALCDLASPDVHPLVERAKDVAAGAVLVAAFAAIGIGIVVFGGRLAALAAP